MKPIALAFCLILLPVSVARAEVDVGGTRIAIPPPPGYELVTPAMTELWEMQKLFVSEGNVELASFIDAEDIPVALQGEIPEMERRFTVQAVRALLEHKASKADFAEFKQFIKTQNDEILKKAEAGIGKTIGNINESFQDDYDIDLALSMTQVLPLPVHAETDRSLAYSAFVNYDINDENGNPSSYVAAVTGTFVHIKGKILFLYCFGEESDLKWGQDISSTWSKRVIEANPSDLQAGLAENLPGFIGNIDWQQVGLKTLIGALVGLVFGVVVWLLNRRKTS